MITQTDLDIIKKLHYEGKSCTKISVLFPVTRQRIYQIIQKYKPLDFKIKYKIKKKNKNPFSSHGGRDLVREKIRIRDNHTCQICNKKWESGQRRFDVHHKDCDKEKTRQYDNYEKEKNNMITLCHKCHLNLPQHRKKMMGKRTVDKSVD